jgi:uncharacterized protein
MRYLLSLTALLWAVLFTPALQAEPEFPALSGRVVDQASVLSAPVIQQLTTLLAQHEAATGNQVVVVTLSSLQGYEIEEFGYQLGREWGIGEKGKDNGVLLIVAPNERKLRIEVGYGLEGTLTDALSKNIIETVITPRFKQKDMPGGIVEGAHAILAVLDGSYEASSERTKGEGKSDHFVVIIMLGFIGGFVARLFLGSRLGGGLVGAAIAVVMGLLFSTLLVAVMAGFISFVLQLEGSRSSGGYSGGGSSGGGFSGGGGSFGGGGASGSW